MKKSSKKVNKSSDKESENFYRYIIENSKEAILLTKPDGTIDYANPEACKLFGRTEKEICKIGRNGIVDLNDPRLPIALEERKRTGKFKGELNFVKKDGTVFPAEVISVIFKDSYGNEKTSMIINDIAEKKEADVKTQLLAHTIKSITEIITITDLEDRFTFVNQAFCNIYGYTYEEIIGQNVKMLVSPNNPPELLKVILKNSRKGGWKGEILNLKKDGREFPISLQTSQIKNEKGEILGLVGVSEDITEQKRIEEVLKKSEEKYHSIFESTGTATMIIEEDTSISMANNECLLLTGYNPKEIIGTKWTSYVAPESLAEMVKYHNLRRKEPGKTPKKYEVKLLHKTGEVRNAILDIGMIPGTKQSIVSILDITERKKAEEELLENQQRLSLFFNQSIYGYYYSVFEKPFEWNGLTNKEEVLSYAADHQYITDINDTMLSQYGTNRESILNRPMSFFFKHDTNNGRKLRRKLFDEGFIHEETFELKDDGSPVWFEGYYKCLYDDEKRIKDTIGIQLDITIRKRAEEALKESEERFRVAQEFSPDGFTILRPVRDDQGLIVDFIWIYENETIARLNGTDSKAVVGKRLLDMFPGHRGSQFFEAYQQVADTGKSRIMESSYQGESISTLTWFRTVIFSMGVDIAILAQNITERKIAEEAIKISEDKFRKVFSTSPDSININRLDDGMYVAINNGFTQSTGYTEEDVEGKTSKELNIWDNSDDRKKLIEGLKTDGIVKNLEARFRKKNGDVNFGLMSASVIDLNGIPHIISITRDISERKKAEEIIRESERKFRETVENLQEGYYKCTIDGILIEHNPAFCEILGFESDNDLSGVKLPDFWQNPEDREVYLKEMEKEGYIKNYTVNAKKTNGEKMYILVNSHLLKDTEDKYIGIEGTIVDLTERKQAEEALKASEVKYKNLIETMPEGFYRSTPEGYFVDVNPAIVKMLGFENKEELMKINIPDELYFSRDERIDGVNYNIDFVPDTEIYRLKKKDGSEIWVEDHSRYIQDSSGKILYHEGIMRDITVSLQAQKAMVEAKEKAEEVSRLKTSFLANMSHEIRTPLNGILGFADILKNELKDPTHKKFADVIEKSGNRLLETLDLILSFSKLEAEKEDVHYSNVRIENVIDEVLKSFEVMAKNKNLFLKLSVKEEKLITNIDERFLRQIMNNLINNAIKYTEAGGITVTLLKDNSNVVIKVKDTGIGIVNDKHKIIFEEFRQESEGHGRSFEGTGLGLAITKRFVELMNGTIEVESEAGIGSIFTVKFPYEKAPETITIKMQKEEPNKKIYMPSVPDKDKLFILLVENDSMNLDFTVTILKDYYNVESAVDGTEALERVKNKAYNIILMDINLGKGMDGIEVVKKIRKLPGYEKTPIVALTAFVLPGDREEFLAGGCTHYLGKPFTKNQILELLKKIKV